MMNEHPIPHSIDAEHAVIGAALLDGRSLDRVVGLRPEHFYVEANREIWRAIMAMSLRGDQIDVVTVAEALSDLGLEERTGGLGYLGEIAMNTPSAANAHHYAGIVMDKAMERELLCLSEDIRALVMSPGAARDKLDRVQSLLASMADSGQRKKPRRVGEALDDYIATLERRNSGEVRGLPTGLEAVDKVLSGGLQDGNLIIVAGRPGMGKSAFTSTIAVNVAEDGQCAAILSMEMTETDQMDRVVATIGRVPLEDVTAARLCGESGDGIVAAFGKMRDLPLVIDEEPHLSIHDVVAKSRFIKRTYGLKLLIVDAIGLMNYDNKNAVTELGIITKGLKVFAKEMNIPIVLLCQLSRKCEERPDKRPVLSDLRDSGNIEQDADVVIMLYRDEYYREDSPDKGIAECLVRKNRQGSPAIVPLAFIGQQTRFANLAGDWRPQESNAMARPKRSRMGAYD